MREFKFRAWDKYHRVMNNWEQYKYELVANDFIENGKGPLEIMQYTGLKDKNDTAIYEGDLVQIGNGDFQCRVYFDDKTQAYMLKDLNSKYIDSINFMSQYEKYKIIGNIYENPELL